MLHAWWRSVVGTLLVLGGLATAVLRVKRYRVLGALLYSVCSVLV